MAAGDAIISRLKRQNLEGPNVLKKEDFELVRRMVLIDGFSQRDVALKVN